VFLYVGTLDRRKGVDRLPGILGEYTKRFGPCELRVVSSTPENALNEFGLSPVPGSVAISHRSGLTNEELVKEYRAASALIHPARYESFGLPLIEAASLGTPIVASRTGIAPELCTGSIAHYVADMERPALVAETLHAAVVHRLKVGHEFYRVYAEHFTRDRMAERYLRLLAKWRGRATPEAIGGTFNRQRSTRQ
jgi:glycosyltransferase involved in cell wall biosynthesis